MQHRDSYGKEKISLVDRFGVYLSLKAIKKHLPLHNKLNILDIGCGYEATLLCALQNKIKSAVGIDFEVNPRLHTLPNYQFIEAPLEDALFKLNGFSPELIMLTSVLEHLKNPSEILSACYQMLQADGVLLINVPTWRGKVFLEFSAFKLGMSPKIEMDDHKMYYDKRDLWPLLIRAGFKPSQVKLRYHKFGLNLFAIARK